VGVANTARLLQVARRAGRPVASCLECYQSECAALHWKVNGIAELVERQHADVSAADDAIRQTEVWRGTEIRAPEPRAQMVTRLSGYQFGTHSLSSWRAFNIHAQGQALKCLTL
jgi:hypothetical protein